MAEPCGQIVLRPQGAVEVIASLLSRAHDRCESEDSQYPVDVQGETALWEGAPARDGDVRFAYVVASFAPSDGFAGTTGSAPLKASATPH
jgi:hypothetical protein